MNPQLRSAARRVATGPLTLHVRPIASSEDQLASDGGDGLFATIQNAVNALMWEWDLRGCPAKIKVADGVYRERVEVRGVPLGSTSRPAIVIEGNSACPSNCVLDVERGHAFENWGGHVTLAGLKITSAEGACIYAHDSGGTLLGAIEFGEAGREHIMATAGHIVMHQSDYEVSGGATMHAHVTDCALYGNGRTVTLRDTPHFREEFHGLNFARARWAGTTFVGSATGMRHLVHYNAVCAIGGASPETFFPGDRPGVVKNFSIMA
jgi:pectin methylesterase-like acyl-CoA thioesterase